MKVKHLVEFLLKQNQELPITLFDAIDDEAYHSINSVKLDTDGLYWKPQEGGSIKEKSEVIVLF